VFTARYGLINYIKQITFHSFKDDIIRRTIEIDGTWIDILWCFKFDLLYL
jgi:hypothetical protein